MRQKAVLLDRDGVLNDYVYNPEFGTVDSPKSPEEFSLSVGAGEAVADFNRLGFVVVVVSNQPGIAKGKPFCRRTACAANAASHVPACCWMPRAT
jgi:D-glycero-D-manno-heptose 1,7-bisphosphate phosphatase